MQHPFSQSRAVRRGALVVALAISVFAGSIFGGVAVASHQFSDVPDSHPFHSDIRWMADRGISTGFPDGTFRPGEPVSRQAMAAFMRRLNDRFVVRQASTDPALSSTFSYTATCSGGERALAGGGRIDFADIFLTESTPTNDGSGWRVVYETDNGVGMNPTNLTVWVLCAPAGLPPDM